MKEVIKINILDIDKIHESWKFFFTNERVNQIKKIETQIGNNINPSSGKVFRFTTTNLDNIKIVILAQDPYPNPKVPTGRAFEVGTLNSWSERFAQHSLKNMIKLIYKSYCDDLIEYEYLKKKIIDERFNILPPSEWFDNMEKQGVLFLNTYLTCQSKKANSHRDIWKDFSKDLLKFISKTNPSIIWFLWGGEAQKNEKHISRGIIYKANHPRLYDTKKPESFLKSTCFRDTKDLVYWKGFRNIKSLKNSLPKDIDNAIEKLKIIIKELPPKICYFNNPVDYVAPFSITCDEEMLMQMLLTEKQSEIKEDDYTFSVKDLMKKIKQPETAEDKRKREQIYLEQVEEGFIRKFLYKK